MYITFKVSSDFKVLYPYCKSIYLKWEVFISKIQDVYVRSLKDKSNMKLFNDMLIRKHQMNIGEQYIIVII